MLVGFVSFAVQTGTLSLAAILADPPTGPAAYAAALLLLAGALSKSALVPFHFWLPGAMAAPTPVSAYLHAAAMVKAGVYLVAVTAPVFAGTPGWRLLVGGLGVATMIIGGWRSLRQDDLKLLLAYGTVSQLGFLVMLTGLGTQATMLAGLAMTVAHALFKSGLFLAVGAIDQATGTREISSLSGIGRQMPYVATALRSPWRQWRASRRCWVSWAKRPRWSRWCSSPATGRHRITPLWRCCCSPGSCSVPC